MLHSPRTVGVRVCARRARPDWCAARRARVSVRGPFASVRRRATMRAEICTARELIFRSVSVDASTKATHTLHFRSDSASRSSRLWLEGKWNANNLMMFNANAVPLHVSMHAKTDCKHTSFGSGSKACTSRSAAVCICIWNTLSMLASRSPVPSRIIYTDGECYLCAHTSDWGSCSRRFVVAVVALLFISWWCSIRWWTDRTCALELCALGLGTITLYFAW